MHEDERKHKISPNHLFYLNKTLSINDAIGTKIQSSISKISLSSQFSKMLF